MNLKHCLLFFIFFSFSLCSYVHYSPKSIPFGWEKTENNNFSSMSLTFALKQQNLDILDDIFWSVSSPKSEHYRKFLTPEQISSLVAPSSSVVNFIILWLTEQNIIKEKIELNPSGDFLIARGVSPSIIQDSFNCKLVILKHAISGKFAQVCEKGYTLPSDIADKLDFVGGFDHFPKIKNRIPLAARDGNGPVLVKVFPGDENFSLFYAPLCDNNTPVTSENLLCSDSNSVIGMNVFAEQYGYSTTFNLADSLCMNCTSWPSALQSYCTQSNEQYGFPASTQYCHSGTIQSSLKNYAPISLSLVTLYTSGSSVPTVPVQKYYLGEFVTPKILKQYYGVSEEQAICQSPENSQSVAEFLGQYYSPADLITFFDITGIRYPGYVELVGVNNVTDPGIEASLDIQYLMGISQNVTTYFWSLTNLHEGQEPFLEWITQVLNAQRPPLVHSISYGDDESSLTSDYMNRINTEFQKAGTVGLTLLFSSGDNGVNAADPSAPSCSAIQAFTPGFPASSPYVTAVGGTQFSTNSEAICNSITQYGVPISCSSMGEISASIATGARITSGGGFSNVFAMPDYQKDVVSAYLETQNIPAGYYNSTGRAYPDISACARNFLVVANQQIHPTDGTSAAAPTAAGLMTLINDKLLANHKQLGFINPTLYSLPSVNFLDIIQGDNKCGEDITACCEYGFTTQFGWDAVTGLGSINFPVLLSSLVSN